MHFESAFLAALNIFVVSIAFKMRQILCHYYCIFFLAPSGALIAIPTYY